MKNAIKFFAIALVAIFAANAYALQLSTDAAILNLEKGQSIGTTVRVTNDSFDVKHLEFEASTYDFELELVPAVKEFTLNPHETTTFSLSVVANDEVEEGRHNVLIEIKGDDYASGQITVEVIEPHRIGLVPEQDVVEICKEPYTHYIKVEVENNGTGARDIGLKAESEILLPIFEPAELSVEGGSSRTVKMRIHINNTTQFGEYNVGLFAFVGDDVVERKVIVDVVDCGRDETPFRLEAIDDSLSIDKGDSENARFRLVSLIDEEQDVRISSVSDLRTEEFDQVMHLDEFESEESRIVVYAEDEDEADGHLVTLYAWNDLGEDSEGIDVEIEPFHKLSAKVLNNDITNRICSAIEFEVFEVEVRNEGDFSERINVSVDNDHETIGIHITDEEFTLDAGESKIVQIAVQPAFDTPIGQKSVTLRVESSRTDFEFEEQLNFTVIHPPEQEAKLKENVLRIISYPRSLLAAPGEQKSMNIAILNPTNESVGPLTVRIRGVSSEFSFTGGNISSIPAGESREVAGTINVSAAAQNKKYDLTLEVVGDGYHSYVPFDLEISNEDAEAQGPDDTDDAGFAGFALLAGLFEGGMLGGLTILMVALALFVIVVVFLLISSNKNRTTQLWVSRKAQGSQ